MSSNAIPIYGEDGLPQGFTTQAALNESISKIIDFVMTPGKTQEQFDAWWDWQRDTDIRLATIVVLYLFAVEGIPSLYARGREHGLGPAQIAAMMWSDLAARMASDGDPAGESGSAVPQ